MGTFILNPWSACTFLYFSIPTASVLIKLVLWWFVFIHGWKRKAFQENIRKKKTLAQFPEDFEKARCTVR